MWFREQAEKSGRRANRRKKTDGEYFLQVTARAHEQKQTRVKWISAVAVLVVAVAGCAWVGVMGADWVRERLFASNPLFAIRNLDIRTDGTLKPQEIREQYNLRPGVNLFAINLGKIHADLLTLPVVRYVEIRRQLPDTLVLRVGERVAMAMLVTARMSLPVDREGRVLVPRAAVTHLPLILGGQLPGLRPGLQINDAKILDALDVLDMCEALRLTPYVGINAINVAQAEHLDLRLASGEQVLLARTRMEDHLRKLASTKKALAERRQTASLIDCSLEHSVPVQLAPSLPDAGL